MKGCITYILLALLLIIVSGLVVVGYLKHSLIFEGEPAKLDHLSKSICAGIVPATFKNVYGLDKSYCRAVFARDISDGMTNGYLLKLETTLVKSIDPDYTKTVKKIFSRQDHKKIAVKNLQPKYFDGTNLINRFYSSITFEDKSPIVVFESYFSYSNRMVMTAFIALNTNAINQGKVFINTVQPTR